MVRTAPTILNLNIPHFFIHQNELTGIVNFLTMIGPENYRITYDEFFTYVYTPGMIDVITHYVQGDRVLYLPNE